MDEILSKFSSAWGPQEQLSNSHDHIKYYMQRGDSQSCQEKRRNLSLAAQKEKKKAQIDECRGILDLIKDAELHEEQLSPRWNLSISIIVLEDFPIVKSQSFLESHFLPDYKIYKPKAVVPGFNKQKPFFADTLMLSEWLVEAPADLAEKWLVLACPKGTRVLVVASKGHTKAYTKQGYFYKAWTSLLPGGRLSAGEYNKYCVLDCIWNEPTKSLFVIDVLAWGAQSLTDCDVNFRNYWLESKFTEMPALGQESADNTYSIYFVPKYECSVESLSNFMMNWPAFPYDQPPVDGLLFYHREAHYLTGTTPLVGWLLPYMVNEILGNDITVHISYKVLKPSNYFDQITFIKSFEEKQTAKKHSKVVFQRRRVQSFSSVSSNSSLNLSNISNQSFGSGIVQMIFGSDKNISQSRESEDIDVRKENKRRKNKQKREYRKNKMETGANVSAEADSAISSMEDSMRDEKIDYETSLDKSLLSMDEHLGEPCMDS